MTFDPKNGKRLAKVGFPIATVSRHSARGKSIRHGHPSTLHLWRARRPLGACRSMLLGMLLPHPCDAHCPADFTVKARILVEKGDARLLEVVTLQQGMSGRQYRGPAGPEFRLPAAGQGI